jgi:hypothetical protein
MKLHHASVSLLEPVYFFVPRGGTASKLWGSATLFQMPFITGTKVKKGKTRKASEACETVPVKMILYFQERA